MMKGGTTEGGGHGQLPDLRGQRLHRNTHRPHGRRAGVAPHPGRPQRRSRGRGRPRPGHGAPRLRPGRPPRPRRWPGRGAGRAARPGPFAHTAPAMAEACLRTGVHYLDVTGEIGVFETLAALDSRARGRRGDAPAGGGLRRGALRLPGAPSEAAAAHGEPPGPGLSGPGRAVAWHRHHDDGEPSSWRGGPPGGASTRAGLLEDADHRLRPGADRGHDDPLGGCVPAWYSTGIPNIEVYMAAPLPAHLLRGGAATSAGSWAGGQCSAG